VWGCSQNCIHQGSRWRAILAKKSPCEGWLRFLVGQKRSSSRLVILKSRPNVKNTNKSTSFCLCVEFLPKYKYLVLSLFRSLHTKVYFYQNISTYYFSSCRSYIKMVHTVYSLLYTSSQICKKKFLWDNDWCLCFDILNNKFWSGLIWFYIRHWPLEGDTIALIEKLRIKDWLMSSYKLTYL